MTWQDFPKWGFVVGAIVTITTFLLTQWLTKKRAQKEFSYSITTSSIIRKERQDLKSSVHDKIEILFNGNKVNDVGIVQIELSNSGNLPITMSDFHEPIRVVFPETVKIVEGELQTGYPTSFRPHITFNNSSVELSKTLMNSGDKVCFSIIVTPLVVPEIEGRIVGISEIKRMRIEGQLFDKSDYFVFPFTLLTTIITSYTLMYDDGKDRNLRLSAILLLVLYSSVLGMFVKMRQLRYRKIREARQPISR